MVDPTLAFGPQPSHPGEGFRENFGTLGTLGLGGIGISAFGFKSLKSGRVWDKYLAGIRAVESGSPGGVLKTFRVSELLSPLQSYSELSALPSDMTGGGKYAQTLKASFGDISSASLRRTGAVFGEVGDGAGKLVGMGLNVESGTQKGSAIADFYARSRGIQLTEFESLNDAILRDKWRTAKTPLSYGEWLKGIEPHLRRERMILGSKLRNKINILGSDIALTESMSKHFAKAETLKTFASAKLASTSSRLNVLLRAPFELPGIREVAKRVPGLSSFSVKPGSNLQLLGRYTGKALLAGAAWKGLEYVDYLRAEGSLATPVVSTLGFAGVGAMLARRPGMRFSKGGLAAGAAFGLYAALSPRFSSGIFHGAASVGTDLNIARAQISSNLGVTEALQRQEEITPGLMNLSTAAAFAGIGGMATGIGSYLNFGRRSAVERAGGGVLSEIFEKTREANAGGLSEKVWGSRIGKKIGKDPLLKHLTKIKNPIALGAVAGVAAWAGISSGLALLSGNPLAAVPGAGILGTTDSPEELQQIYSGEKEVGIRKGRWWEFGRSTAYGGGKIEYYRPHFMARLGSRAYQKGLWGSEEEKWAHDPMANPLKALFGSDEWKYAYEEKYQYDRPAPLTGTYGEDVPFIGPALAATFGKLFKPRKEIRPEEWNLGGGRYLHRPDARGEGEPSYELGGLGPGAPVAPEDPSQVLNDLNYRRREAVGLMGFAEGSITKAAIGREEFLENKQTMATMGGETSSNAWMWKHMNLGGGLGTTEAVRRFLPRERSYLEKYNPLKNNLASWMPNDYFLDLKHGNPFDKIPEAEIRLPGSGYAALHPELEGVNPENYPLSHRVKILGDVAMWSPAYQASLAEAKSNLNNFSDSELNMIRETERQVLERKKKKNFSENVFTGNDLSTMNVTVSDVIGPRRIKTKEFGDMTIEIPGTGAIIDTARAEQLATELMLGKKIQLKTSSLESRRYKDTAGGPVMRAAPMIGGQDFGSILAEAGFAKGEALEDEYKQIRYSSAERAAGTISESIMHGAETPFEYLTPISPASKLIRQRTGIEDYIATQAIGTGNSFWDKPFENFLKPAIDVTAYKLGSDSIPDNIQQRRDIQSHFDMLQWVKSGRLEEEARAQGDRGSAADYKREKSKTLFGADVFGSPEVLIKALPRSEQAYFKSFSGARTEADRRQILELIPEDERRVYLSQWMRQEESAAYAKRDAGMSSKGDQEIIQATAAMRQSEGFSASAQQRNDWEASGGGAPFDDYMREEVAEEYFQKNSLPGADWLGWHPQVDLEDVKMQYVEQAGLDFHDFDLWGARKRSLARKPYINNSMVAQMGEQAEYDAASSVAHNAKSLAARHGLRDTEITYSQIDNPNGKQQYKVDTYDGRRGLIEKAYKEIGV